MNVSRYAVPIWCGVFLFFVLGILAPCRQSRAAAPEPMAQVSDSVDQIINILKDEGLADPAKREERRQLIFAEVDRRFDFREMSMRTLAKHWKNRTPAEQDNFVDLFAKLVVNRYIDKIESYTDEKVTYDKQAIRNTVSRVYTFILSKGKEIPIVYSLVKRADEWLVYDVVIEGISLVRNYRSEFDSILAKENYEGLVQRMQDKVVAQETAVQ